MGDVARWVVPMFMWNDIGCWQTVLYEVRHLWKMTRTQNLDSDYASVLEPPSPQDNLLQCSFHRRWMPDNKTQTVQKNKSFTIGTASTELRCGTHTHLEWDWTPHLRLHAGNRIASCASVNFFPTRSREGTDWESQYWQGPRRVRLEETHNRLVPILPCTFRWSNQRRDTNNMTDCEKSC